MLLRVRIEGQVTVGSCDDFVRIAFSFGMVGNASSSRFVP